jgi:hypothetical protein
VNYVDNAVTRASITAEEDIAGMSPAVRVASQCNFPSLSGFVVHILTHLPPDQLENKMFRIQGEAISATEYAALVDAPLEKVDKIPGDDRGFITTIAELWATGAGSTGWDRRSGTEMYTAGQDNALWPGHAWKTLRETLDK